LPVGAAPQFTSGSNHPLIATSSDCRAVDRQRPAALQRLIAGSPVRGLVGRRWRFAHAHQLPHWIHDMNLCWFYATGPVCAVRPGSDLPCHRDAGGEEEANGSSRRRAGIARDRTQFAWSVSHLNGAPEKSGPYLTDLKGNGGRPRNRTWRASPRGSYSPLPHLAACRPHVPIADWRVGTARRWITVRHFIVKHETCEIDLSGIWGRCRAGVAGAIALVGFVGNRRAVGGAG